MTAETDIPIPEPQSGRKPHITDLDGLVKGQSRFFPVGAEAAATIAALLRAVAHRRFGKGNYTTRTLVENDQLGIRVWRTG